VQRDAPHLSKQVEDEQRERQKEPERREPGGEHERGEEAASGVSVASSTCTEREGSRVVPSVSAASSADVIAAMCDSLPHER